MYKSVSWSCRGGLGFRVQAPSNYIIMLFLFIKLLRNPTGATAQGRGQTLNP